MLFLLCLKKKTKKNNQQQQLEITGTKLYVPVVTSSTQDNAMLEQSKSAFKSVINWNKYQSKLPTEIQNQYLDFSFNPSFQGVNRLFVFSFENEYDRRARTGYSLPKVNKRLQCYDRRKKTFFVNQ